MSERFESLPEEKRKRIMDACIEEFAQNGYENASTNAIVKKAGISKGILFHYFGSKKNLFLYTAEYVLEYFTKRFYADKEAQPSDVFERLMWLGIWKLKMFAEQPLMSKFLFTSFYRMSEDIKEELTNIIEKYYAYFMLPLMDKIDTSKFRKGVDPNKTVELINICLNGLSDKYMKIYRNLSVEDILGQADKIMEEFRGYLDIIKFGAYGE